MVKISLGLCCRDDEGFELESQFEQAVRLGFDRIQLSLWNMDRLNECEGEKTKKLLDKYGLTCTEVWCGWQKPAFWDFRNGPASLGLVPAEYRAVRTTNLLGGAAYARGLGVTDVITHLGFIPQNPADPNYAGVVIALKYLTTELARHGQVFSIETGQETPVVARRCIEDVGADNFGVNYDPANLMIYGSANPIDGLDILAPYVRSVHAKDGTYPKSGYEPGEERAMGEGSVDMPAFVAKLKAIGFAGTMSIEHERAGLNEQEKEREILNAKNLLEKLI